MSAPLWGLFCDRKAPKAASMCGAVLMIFSFLFMGPLPPFGLTKTIPLVGASLVAHGKKISPVFSDFLFLMWNIWLLLSMDVFIFADH